MYKKSKEINYTGYIEGYYGKLLTWNNRKRIINKLSQKGMSTYFYAPKEDIFHRQNWRKCYPYNIKCSFSSFIKFSNKKNIEVIVGIAPGLDFDLSCVNSLGNIVPNSDLDILKKKCLQIISFGVTSIALMFDDIEVRHEFNINSKKNEGSLHAQVANFLCKTLKIQIFVVPRVYSDELIKTNNYYLNNFFKTINKKIKIFYCGKNIVSKTIPLKLLKNFDLDYNRVIIWDNFFANDYCPKKLFLGPLSNRAMNTNIMINPTGMIETDLLLLDIFSNFLLNQNSYLHWKITIKKHKIPEEFFLISFLLENPFTKNKPDNDLIKNMSLYIKAIDFLLWKWKTPLSLEWYNYLFNLKYDILIYNNKVSVDRLTKILTIPLIKHLN